MKIREEKNGNFWIFCTGMMLWYFMSGIEYGIILANINDYLLKVGAPQKSIGYAFTFFAFSGLISSPIYGHLCDKLKSVKLPIITAMLFSITGSMTMALGGNLIMIFVGRFLMGFGWGIDGPIVGKIALLRQDDASTFIPILLVMRQVGIICGPFFIFWTKTWDFNLFGTEINSYNSASLLISFLWILVLVFNIIATFHEPRAFTAAEREEREIETTELSNGHAETNNNTINNEKEEKYEDFKYIQIKPLPPMTEQICVCIVSSLSAYILQSTLESMVTPLTKQLLGWGQKENALFFVGVGITAVIGYLTVTFLGRCFKPRMTLAIGVVIEFTILIAMTFILPAAEFRAPWLMPAFVAMTAVFIFALPFIVVSSATLMAKFTDESQQSTIQGVRVAAERVAQICGPLWGAEVLHNFYLVFLFPAIFLLVTMLLQGLSWSWLDDTLFKKDAQIQVIGCSEKKSEELIENKKLLNTAEENK